MGFIVHQSYSLGMVAVAPGMGALSAGVPVQYMQQTPMPNQAHQVIQYNGKQEHLIVFINLKLF